MKKSNLVIIATIIATIFIGIFAVQPTDIEAKSNVLPNATPSPRKKRPIVIQSPKPIQSPITKSRTKAKQTGFQEVSGIGMEVTRKKQPRRKSTQQYNPKEIGIDNIKAKRTTAKGRSMNVKSRKKQPRKTNRGKR